VPTSDDLKFHLIIPVTESSPGLCKALLSAAVLGYPTPTIVNWKKDVEGLSVKARRWMKVKGILTYLDSFGSNNNDDMVLVIDGYDVWFQLRPDVLMQRYHQVNKEGNIRIEKQLGKDLMEKHGIQQTVVFGAKKSRWPGKTTEPSSYAVPPSPLAADIYGPETDSGPKNITRERWLNSGTVMGPLKDVRAIYAGAQKMWEEMKLDDSYADQYYFSNLFGEQEYHRSVLAKDTNFAPGPWEQPDKAELTIPNFSKGDKSEYRIGLDYKSEIVLGLNMASAAVDFVLYNGTENIDDVQRVLEVSPPRNLSLPVDLEKAVAPYDDGFLSEIQSNKTGHENSWADVPLFTNFWQSQIPAMIHINGNKTPVETMWNRMWFIPEIRQLYEWSVLRPDGPIIANDPHIGGKSWLDGREKKGGAWSGHSDLLPWSELCGAYEEEIFVKPIENERDVYGIL
jgi:hypothetical protein